MSLRDIYDYEHSIPTELKASDAPVRNRFARKVGEFSANWEHGHITKAGWPARILTTDLQGHFPIVAAVKTDEATGEEVIMTYSVDGCVRRSFEDAGRYDLFNLPASVKAYVLYDTTHKKFRVGTYDTLIAAQDSRFGLTGSDDCNTIKILELRAIEGDGVHFSISEVTE